MVISLCPVHHLEYLDRGRGCPHCREGLEPAGYLKAFEDFRGVPLPMEFRPPEARPIRYRTVVRLLGQQLADLVREEQDLLAGILARKKVLYREMRRVRMNSSVMHQAVRAHLGMPGAIAKAEDPTLMLYLDALENEEGDW